MMLTTEVQSVLVERFLNLIVPFSSPQGFRKFPLPEGEGQGEGDEQQRNALLGCIQKMDGNKEVLSLGLWSFDNRQSSIENGPQRRVLWASM